MMKATALGTLLSVVVFSSCGSRGEVRRSADGRETLSGYITLSGAFALYPLAVQWADEFHRLHPDVDIDISAGGAGKGITDVLADQVDLGMVSRELKPAEVERGTWAFAVAKDAVVATVNKANPAYQSLMQRGLSRQAAQRLWKGEGLTWADVVGAKAEKTQGSILKKVNVYTRSDACGAGETWAAFLGTEQEDLHGTGLFGDPSMAETLQKDAAGIGFNNIGYAYSDKTRRPLKGLAIVPLDINNNGKIDPDENFYQTLDRLMQAVSEGKYPTPPARNLYLVTRGKPTNPVVKAFLEYVLTKGQAFNSRVGFVGISDGQRRRGMERLK